MTQFNLKIGQFVRLMGNHERAGECGLILEISGSKARFIFHYDGIETVQPLKNFDPNTLVFHGL